ncbi:MAG: diguanylate cyclase [Ruminococcaceae bacterium]|nr:diguanylate cyclase [Oscillospiraceae bacterium]
MNESIHTLMNRRSIRKYDSRPVPDELLDIVLAAGIHAPSGMNTQGVRLVAVRDAETIALMSKLNAAVMNATSDPFYGAPCVIVVLADPEIYGGWVEDGALAMGNLMNAAYALGLGSCWIHRAKQVFDAPEGKELLRKWGLPEHLRGVGNCILGYPACDHPTPAPRKEGRIVKVG